jgi:hypothetical protein
VKGTQPIPYARAKTAYDAHKTDYEKKLLATPPLSNSVFDCFCTQQSALDYTFQLPPYSSREKELCSEWSLVANAKALRTWLAGFVVVGVDLCLKKLIKHMVGRERRKFTSERDMEILLYLFAAQYINTALLLIFVHANLRAMGVFADFINVFNAMLAGLQGGAVVVRNIDRNGSKGDGNPTLDAGTDAAASGGGAGSGSSSSAAIIDFSNPVRFGQGQHEDLDSTWFELVGMSVCTLLLSRAFIVGVYVPLKK